MIVFHAKGPREVVPLERAKEILREFEDYRAKNDDGSSPVTVNLSLMAWTATSLQVLQPFLESLRSRIVDFQIDDIVASLPTSDGLATYELLVNILLGEEDSCAPLEVLNLNDNAVGERGIQILRPLLEIPTLRSISMQNLGLSLADCHSISEALLKSSSANTTLQHLSMGRNQVGAEGTKVIGQKLLPNCPNLTSLEYGGCRPLVQGTYDLLQGLTTNTELESIDLSDCHLKNGDDDTDPVHLLLDIVRNNPKLQHLVIPDCELEWEGVKLVLEALAEQQSPIQSLDLEGNDVEGVDCAEEMADLLSKLNADHLTKLNLSSWSFEDDGILLLAPCLVKSTPQLTELSLKSNIMTADGIQGLIDNPLPKLRRMDLFDNEIPKSMGTVLSKMYQTVMYDPDDLVSDGEDEDEQEDLTEAMSKAAIV